MSMMRFYPALLFYRGPGRWEARMLDWATWGQGATQQDALDHARTQLQETLDAMDDHQELPWPTHQLVTEHKLVVDEAHGWALIGLDTRLESELGAGVADYSVTNKEKSNDSEHKGNKTVRRR